MIRCEDCGGQGDKFILPRGNPFAIQLPQLAQALRKVKCFRCDGSGYVRAPGLNIGSAPWPEGIPSD